MKLQNHFSKDDKEEGAELINYIVEEKEIEVDSVWVCQFSTTKEIYIRSESIITHNVIDELRLRGYKLTWVAPRDYGFEVAFKDRL